MQSVIRLHSGAGMRQIPPMYFFFFWEVVKRAFTPAPRVTDMLQILAASALPATSKFVGVKLPQDAGENALAYIGLAALSFVIIRLFWAPYSIWREQSGEIGNLKLEMTKPQRLEFSRMAHLRADAKAELASAIARMAYLAMSRDPMSDSPEMSALVAKSVALCGRANASQSFELALNRLGHLCLNLMQNKEMGLPPMIQLVNAMQAYLHGELTAEGLALQLPQGNGPETQP